MINIQNIFEENNIPYWSEGKNVRAGWVNIQCPFCDDHSNHCGINPESESVYCWKCGHHFLDTLLKELLRITIFEAKNIIKENRTNDIKIKTYRRKPYQNKNLDFPKGTGELQPIHKNYLIRRKFDSEKIKSEWGIKGTGVLGEYNYRVIIPVVFNNQMVTYQGRDVTGKSEIRYKACRPEYEIIPIKNILYGIDKIKNRKAIIVEGVFDVWRLGAGSIATFGTSYTQAQIALLQKKVDEAFLLFDPGEEEAIKKSVSMAGALSALKIKSWLIELPGINTDPGDMTGAEAEYLRKNLLGY